MPYVGMIFRSISNVPSSATIKFVIFPAVRLERWQFQPQVLLSDTAQRLRGHTPSEETTCIK
jgi:hypothetical protein